MKEAVITGFLTGALVGVILIFAAGYLENWWRATSYRRWRK
ncbi:hypothetical protein [Methylotuvimicrobium sp. KM1]